jgi:hypothetical protein
MDFGYLKENYSSECASMTPRFEIPMNNGESTIGVIANQKA